MHSPSSRDAKLVLRGGHRYRSPERMAAGAKERRAYLAIKRMLDMTAAAIGLVLLAPLLLLVALLIKLEDPRGAVFFSQTRIGKDGLPFRMFKFRSMVHNAEELLQELLARNEIEGAMFKMKDDPRITRIGKFIRKTSIDELPQLLNVLRGEMSLVGPRPPLPREVAEYTAHDRQRLAVVPGCTGLWQVSGRNELSFAEMVELDLHYIRRRNTRFDLLILLRTVKVLAGARDAF
ncbi:sugar transferase [Paenibacillus sabuli]